ncbi:serine/threonine protein kinase [Jeotgalibacillus terrae]|uniref:Serine/threonine protein kinase n=1 Tax=Jeotgalibacillus terrae TaxID=587735 RepID=A0ABW5ZJQ2_9BACL|nr:protein kinase [Jeotgalibacillus terrae]MBM7579668.1 serine/threonine-protein kinase [Jeotgalibacillus terrae]
METVHWLIKKARQKIMDHQYLINEVLADRYKIEKVLQNGSYGIIYLCEDLHTGTQCVVKQMRKSKGKENTENYHQETTILQQLSHPGIPALIETFSFEDKQFFSMEFVEGKNVEDTLFATGQQYTEKECLEIVRKLTGIVCYIHQQGVYHGDIRIPNVLLHHSHLYLIDFGLASNLHTDKRLKKQQALLAQDDFFDVGDFLLFLLYSSYDGKIKKRGSWTEELSLHPQTTLLLKRLLNITEPYQQCEEIQSDLEKAISQLT